MAGRASNDPTNQNPRGYSYGDDGLALDRLRLLARVFAASSEAFLAELPAPQPNVVLDLGCGPGETTRLLAERFPQAHVTGIDSSPSFLTAAVASRHPTRVNFVLGDVTGRLPRAGADLIYARLLLAHLRGPLELIRRWATQLRPGGLLAIEEIERVETEDECFLEHLEVAATPLRARGSDMCAGALLAAISPLSRLEIASRTRLVRPPASQAARLFAMNLNALRRDPAVAATYSPSRLDRLTGALRARADGDVEAPIAWTMRQLTLSHGGD